VLIFVIVKHLSEKYLYLVRIFAEDIQIWNPV